MQQKKFSEYLAQLAGLLGFSAVFFPGMITGASLLFVFLQALLVSLLFGLVAWMGAQSFLKWKAEQMKPILEEIEVPQPPIAPVSPNTRRSGKYKSVNIKG